jgi:hypothetical protein
MAARRKCCYTQLTVIIILLTGNWYLSFMKIAGKSNISYYLCTPAVVEVYTDQQVNRLSMTGLNKRNVASLILALVIAGGVFVGCINAPKYF